MVVQGYLRLQGDTMEQLRAWYKERMGRLLWRGRVQAVSVIVPCLASCVALGMLPVLS